MLPLFDRSSVARRRNRRPSAGARKRLLLSGLALLVSLFASTAAARVESAFHTADALVTEGRYEEAKSLLETTRFEGGDAIPAAYLLAVVYARKGDLDRAEKLLRQILSREPGIDAVRIELVKILAAQGKRQGASYQLSRLTDTADLARDKDQLEQLARQIGSTEGFSLSGYVSLAPSTNVNDGTSQSIIMIGGLPFLIANGARQQSGVGVRTGLVGGYAHSFDERHSAYASVSAGLSDYSNDQFDRQHVELRTGVRHDRISYSLQAEVIVDRHWQNMTASSLGIGGRVSGKWNFSQGWWLSGEIIRMHRRFDLIPAANAVTTRGTVALRHAFSNRFAMSVSGTLETESVAARSWSSYMSPSATLGLEAGLMHGIWMNASLSAGSRNFEGLFPGLRLVRRDTFQEARASFRKDNFEIAGLSPIVGIFRREQQSNVAFYQYATTGLDLTFTKAF